MTSVLVEGIKVIPVHLYSIFSSRHFSFHSNLDKTKFDSLIKELKDDEPYILDFNNIRNTLVSDSIAKINNPDNGLLQKNILMVNLKGSTYKAFQQYFGDELFDFNENTVCNNCLMTKQFSECSVNLSELNEFTYLKNYLKEKCILNMRKNNEPALISSNVYINKFFDLREIFIDMDTVKITVFLLAIKLKELEEQKILTNYKLVSSSFNGCILANIISLIMGKKHIIIPHLDPNPDAAVKDNRYLRDIKKNDKLVYIYDFIALGNEQKTVSIILKLFNAEIVYSIGLSYYKPYRKMNEKTYSLIKISDIIDRIIITAEKEDLITLIEAYKNEKF